MILEFSGAIAFPLEGGSGLLALAKRSIGVICDKFIGGADDHPHHPLIAGTSPLKGEDKEWSTQ